MSHLPQRRGVNLKNYFPIATPLVPVKHGKPPRYFQRLSRTCKQNSRTFQDSKKIKDFSRMWQPWHQGLAAFNVVVQSRLLLQEMG